MEAISCFSDILTLSMFDEDIRDKFAPYFAKGQTCAFIGSSGVGKCPLCVEVHKARSPMPYTGGGSVLRCGRVPALPCASP